MLRWRLFLLVSVLVLGLPVAASAQEEGEETSLESPFRYHEWFDAGLSYYFYEPAPTCGPVYGYDGAAATDDPENGYDGAAATDNPENEYDGAAATDNPENEYDGAAATDNPEYEYDGAAATDDPAYAYDGAAAKYASPDAGAICLDGYAAAPDADPSIVADSYTSAEPSSFDQASADALAYEESFAEPLPAETPDVEVFADPTALQARSPSRGFNTTQQVGWNAADIDRALDEMVASRSSVHRLTVFWAVVQPNGPEEWRWEAYDTVISRARARGLRLILNPTGSPNWARNANRRVPYEPFGKFAYPDNAWLPAWRTFIRQLAIRYNPVGFEIWNEQNSRAFWDPTPTHNGPNPARWTTLFCGAKAAIRGVRSAETVGMGGLAPHRTNRSDGFGLRNLRASEFVRLAYLAGAGRCSGIMNFVGYHPYVINRYCIGREQDLNTTPGMQELASVRERMVRRGHGARTIWITEWGFPSQTFRESATANCRYTEARQAEMIRREHTYLRRLPYTRFSIYFNIRDAPGNPLDDAFLTVGMLRVDWSRKPSFTTWTRLP